MTAPVVDPNAPQLDCGGIGSNDSCLQKTKLPCEGRNGVTEDDPPKCVKGNGWCADCRQKYGRNVCFDCSGETAAAFEARTTEVRS